MAKLKTAFDKHIYSTFFFLLLTLVLIISCRKIDVLKANQSPKVNPETRFFIEHASNDPFVKSVLGFVRTGEREKTFCR